ncbi:MAG: hypothetical protein ABIR91_04870 [Candidatus Saccharimonadales bacterium]
MKNHGGMTVKPQLSELLSRTSHHEVQLTDSTRPTYVSNTDHMAARTLDLLVRETSIVNSELREVQQLPAPADSSVAANTTAVDFVERTVGPTAKNGLYGIPENYSATGLGFTTAVLGAVAIRPCAHEDGSRQAIAMQSALVHEQAHSTALPTRKIMMFDHKTIDEDGDDFMTYNYMASVGMQKHKISYDHDDDTLEFARIGSYLEEAFAEETASRYRADLYQNNDIDMPVVCSDDVIRSMPIRYFSIDERDPSYLCWISAAFAAHAVHLLSEYTGTDIYDLMTLSRDPA